MKFLVSLGKRLLRTLLTAVVVLLLGVLGFWYFFLYHPEPDRPSGAGPQGGTPILPTTPKESVRAVYHYVAAKQPAVACALFSKEGAQRFAADLGEPTCAAAVQHASTQVQDKSSYGDPKFRDDAAVISDASASVSSCAMSWSGGGPRLGSFILQRQQNGGWIISGHQNDPADCVTG